MTEKSNKLGLYILLLSITIGAVVATILIHYSLASNDGHIVLGDSTHGLVSVRRGSYGTINTSLTKPTYQIPPNTVYAGSKVASLGNL
jgi:hypothetical protein